MCPHRCSCLCAWLRSSSSNATFAAIPDVSFNVNASALSSNANASFCCMTTTSHHRQNPPVKQSQAMCAGEEKAEGCEIRDVCTGHRVGG